MTLTLAKNDVFVTLNEIGEGVVLETEFDRKTSESFGPKAHYLDTSEKAAEFVIRGAYGLMTMGYEVVR